MLRLSVDFNSMMRDTQERVQLNTEYLQDKVNQFQDKLLVIVFDEEMQVEAVLEFEKSDASWFAKPDWSTSYYFKENK